MGLQKNCLYEHHKLMLKLMEKKIVKSLTLKKFASLGL